MPRTADCVHAVRKTILSFRSALGKVDTIITMSTNAYRSPHHTPRVLVVEDDAAVLMMLTEVLRDQGYCVASAATPEQAQRLVTAFRPQIIVIGTDGRGTFERGWRLAAGLRQEVPGLPLIMVSTSDAAVAEVGMTDRGRLFDAALLKPFRMRELVAHIQGLLPDHSADAMRSNSWLASRKLLTHQ